MPQGASPTTLGPMSRLDPSAVPRPAGPDRLRRRYVLLGGAIVGLLLVIGLVFALLPREPAPPPGPVAASPADAVRGYLDALAAGRAADALAYAVQAPTDTAWLTDEALAAANKAAALTVESVTDVAGVDDKATVAATVRFGEELRQLQVPVTKRGAAWRLDGVSTALNLAAVPTTFPITINGTLAPTNATLTVFPGAYVIASGLPEVSLPKEPVLADALGQAFEITLAPTLTPAGEQRLVTLAKQSLAQCLKEKKLAPSGCPNAVAPAAGQTMSEKTITWTLVGNPWKKPTYEVSAAQPTVATGRSRFTFRLRGSLKQGSLTFTVDQELPYVVSFQADLTNVTGPVTWTRQ